MDTTIYDGYVNTEVAAKYLGIKLVTLRNWIRQNRIPAHRIGKQWKFKISELDEWVNSGESAIK